MAKVKTKEVGRPTKYQKSFDEQARKLCLLGATDEEIADFFGIRTSTYYNWQKAHPEFLESIKKGKLIADAEVADRLHQRAMGYEHDDVHISSYQGDITETAIRKYYPPDTGAAFIWLKNRRRLKPTDSTKPFDKQPMVWKDKQEHEIAGPGGQPLMGDQIVELARKAAFMLDQAKRKKGKK